MGGAASAKGGSAAASITAAAAALLRVAAAGRDGLSVCGKAFRADLSIGLMFGSSND